MSKEEKVEEKVETKKEEIYEEFLEEGEKVKEEKVITINLRNSKKAPQLKRAKRAINELKNRIAQYTKLNEVIIHNNVNMIVWQRGAKKPPSRIKVRLVLTDKNKALVLPLQ
ncbi:MAG: 50S ribosomal protein L31e [Thermoproteota archaeon]|jgi:Ribosomal protein L31E